jgi:nucleoside-diphosphate-sugar epimerase
MKVAITGASGYVGGCLAAGFRRHGHEVLALSRRPCPALWAPYALGDDPSQLPWQGVEVLVHAAYDFTANTWQEFVEKNIDPSIALLKAGRHAGVARLIFISSMSSFDTCRSRYGRAKLKIEKEALALGATVIRPGLVWGENSGGVMGTLEKLVTKLPVVPFLIGGKNSNQFLIHEADLAEAVVAIAESLPVATGSLYSVMHPAPVSLRKILQCIAKRSGQSRIYLPVPWQAAMAGLKSIEALGIHSLFRSDSLTGLIHGNPHPENTTPPAGVSYRPFA